jgi:hypothetical protein
MGGSPDVTALAAQIIGLLQGLGGLQGTGQLPAALVGDLAGALRNASGSGGPSGEAGAALAAALAAAQAQAAAAAAGAREGAPLLSASASITRLPLATEPTRALTCRTRASSQTLLSKAPVPTPPTPASPAAGSGSGAATPLPANAADALAAFGLDPSGLQQQLPAAGALLAAMGLLGRQVGGGPWVRICARAAGLDRPSNACPPLEAGGRSCSVCPVRRARVPLCWACVIEALRTVFCPKGGMDVFGAARRAAAVLRVAGGLRARFSQPAVTLLFNGSSWHSSVALLNDVSQVGGLRGGWRVASGGWGSSFCVMQCGGGRCSKGGKSDDGCGTGVPALWGRPAVVVTFPGRCPDHPHGPCAAAGPAERHGAAVARRTGPARRPHGAGCERRAPPPLAPHRGGPAPCSLLGWPQPAHAKSGSAASVAAGPACPAARPSMSPAAEASCL